MSFVIGYDVNVDEINREVESHRRIRPPRHDRTRRPSASEADRHHRMLDLCAELLERFGSVDEAGFLVGGIVPNDAFDRLAFDYDLMDDPDRHQPGSSQWHSERKALSTARNRLRGRVNGRARVYETPFQLMVDAHGRSMRIDPIEQFALDTPKRSLKKMVNNLIGSHQEVRDLLSRDDITSNQDAKVRLEMWSRSIESLCVMAHTVNMQVTRDIRAITGNAASGNEPRQKLLF